MQYVEVQGVRVPALGFGTWQLSGEACREAVRHALELGYRQIDTARMYRNEAEVGQGMRDSGVAREEVFLTTKLPRGELAGNQVGPTTDASLKALQVDYIDLLLIHWPNEEIPLKETLDAMVKQKQAGKVRHLGVSNFRGPLLEEALGHTQILADQVPYQPGRTQNTLTRLCQERDVILTAYSPLARGRIAGDSTLEEIGRAHGKSASQVALRWLLQQPNVSPIPRSANPDHREANLAVFDFELSQEEMQRIFALAQKEGS